MPQWSSLLRTSQRRLAEHRRHVMSAEVPPSEEERRSRTFMVLYGVVLGAGILGFIALAVFGLALRRLDMLLALAVLAVADGSNFLLNALLHRPRPFGYGVAVVQHITTNYSFPSGHVEHAVAFLGVVVFLSFQVIGPLAWWQSALLWLARISLLAVIVLMLPSRVLEGEHWPSDGLAGLLYGGFWLIVAILAYGWAARRWPQLLGIREPPPATALPKHEAVPLPSRADATMQPHEA